MNIKLVGVSIEELEAALKFSGLYVDGEAIRAVPQFLRDQKQTTLDMWEKIGEHQDRERELQSKLDKVESALRGESNEYL